MADLRDMQLLAALARHEHFARAAQECGISQPAFSARIRNLETELGVPVVRRGNRFMGFTPEGLIALRWARQMVWDADGMRQEIEAAKGALSGRLSIGAVPTALAFAARAPARLRRMHPDLAIQLYSMTSVEIRRGIDDFTLDAGITYIDGTVASLRTETLYDERYVLLAPPALAPRMAGEASWREAADLPLCLLTRNMRNRQILDAVFERAGAVPRPVMETNSFIAALAQVASGSLATIAPELLADSLPSARGAVRLALTGPAIAEPVGLVTAARDPVPPMLVALEDVARGLLKRDSIDT